MKKTIQFILLAIFASSFSYAKDLKIGYVDIDEVISSSQQLKQINKKIDSKFKEKIQELINFDAKIKKMVTKNSKNIKKGLYQKIINSIGELDQRKNTLDAEINNQRNSSINKIQQLVIKIIEKVAKKKKIDVVLYSVVYASEKIDITKTISTELKKAYGK